MEYDKRKYQGMPWVVDRWKLFLLLEKSFAEAEKYVLKGTESNSKNLELLVDRVYSNQYKEVIFRAADEFASLAKEMAGLPKDAKVPVEDVAKKLVLLHPYIGDTVVDNDYVSRTPLSGWARKEGGSYSLSWWSSYYKLKKGAEIDFKYATLGLCLDAVGSVYILNLFNIKHAFGNLAMARDATHFRVGIND
ncbi:hypothetical protein SAMN02910298_01423 [Pseudobutyrivibrio sp. YE44]|uniref:hypothetical protein n=1 Tax=Pseudobutyrivibrio sp. YE44 TaxID=1520802 RepID=UPI0008886494|nr:hypothetical protein [Pseudobutyrivibrio sp. YE44]SDB29190.1 hypothetical protein SAMN02910298_01423 [Pseudobutyrivibrio sp. YE44]